MSIILHKMLSSLKRKYMYCPIVVEIANVAIPKGGGSGY